MTQIDTSLIEMLVRKAVEEYVSGLATPAVPADPMAALFQSPAVLDVRREIVRNAHKLWQRQYVDGNGGNLSSRISADYVICTPTMFSKGDLTPDDLCLCDMEGNLLHGRHPRSSELLLHLAIYKANPAARAVVHCHPPHATAYALAGLMPPVGLIPEQEVLVGPAPLATYATPGTQQFADTVVPFVKSHTTVLLANHGVVCWADTVTHAEWRVEVIETYCQMLLLSRQLGPAVRLSSQDIDGLLDIKRRLGILDPRLQNASVQSGEHASRSFLN